MEVCTTPRTRPTTVGFALLALLLLFLGCSSENSGDARTARAPDALRIDNFYPDKARYEPGGTVTLTAEISNPSPSDASGTLDLRIEHLGRFVIGDSRDVALPPAGTATETFTFTAPDQDFTGYATSLSSGGGNVVSTGLDISSTAVRFPRYGYISEFTPALRDQEVASISVLAREFHINMLQFYDWAWRHEKLIDFDNGGIADSWSDIFGRVNAWPVILDLVQTAHDYNVMALGYVMIYAARERYAQLWPIEPAWGLFANPDAADQLDVLFPFSGNPILFLFDPANAGWQDWIIGQYTQAVRLAGFDGVHIDQLGPRYNVYNGSGQPVDLPAAFPPFLKEAKKRLLANDPAHAVCAFNIVDGAVDGWAVREVATSDSCDFLYSEIWYETNSYDDLRRYVEFLRNLGNGRAVVLAGYTNYNEQIGPIQEAEEADSLQGVTVSSKHPGFTGTGFIDHFDSPGDAITWDFSIFQETTLVSFVFRYANATGQITTRNVYLDGNLIGTVLFGSREQWSTWAGDAFIQTIVAPGTHTLRIAYDADNTGTINLDHVRFGELDEDSVRLENAVIFASGAGQIQIGDNLQILAHEYYPNHSKSLTISLRKALRRYYDFMTAYENLLFDPELAFVENPAGNLRALSGQTLLTSGAGGIMTIARRHPGPPSYNIVHLINLIGVDNDLWRDEAPTPQFQENIVLRFYGDDLETIAEVFVATPDVETAIPAQPIAFVRGSDERGDFIEFTVERLEYWDMIFMEHAV